MTTQLPDFQRARSAEQRDVRRQAILATATELLEEMPVGDISLRELSRRAGLSKTGVVRYFATTEAVFLELLDRAFSQWLKDLPAELAAAGPQPSPLRVTDALARSLTARPLLCGLISTLGRELRRDRQLTPLADLLRRHITALTPAAALELAMLTVVCMAGLRPLTGAAPARTRQEGQPPCGAEDFTAGLSRVLGLTLTGLLELQ